MGCGSSVPLQNNPSEKTGSKDHNERRPSNSSNISVPQSRAIELGANSNPHKVTIVDPRMSLDKNDSRAVQNISSKETVSTTSNQNSKKTEVLVSPRSMYKGIALGNTVLIRDCFTSKYSGQVKYKWRETEILEVDEENPRRIFIHFIGWNPNFDAWIDIEDEINKVAPLGLLSKAEMDSGAELNETQMQLVKYFLLTGSYSASSSNENHPESNNSVPSSSDAGKNFSTPVKGDHSHIGGNASINSNSTPSSSLLANRYYALEKNFSSEVIIQPKSYEVGQMVRKLLYCFYFFYSTHFNIGCSCYSRLIS
jgi:hypothetical protein